MKTLIISIILLLLSGNAFNLDLDLKSIIIEKNMILKFENQYFIVLPKYILREIDLLRIPNYDLIKYLINEKNLSNNNEEIFIDSINLRDYNTYENKTNISDENKDGEQVNICINIVIIVALTIFGGIMSGLTVGYLSIDDLEVELKSINGTEKDKINAQKVLPILTQRHWLLVSLLLMNSSAMEALPLFLNVLLPEYLVVIISVTLVLLFGEIIPQALCTGPNQINIAANLSPFTRFFMFATSPISFPIGKMLDYCFGQHTKSRFLNTELKTLIELHTHNALEKLKNEVSSLEPRKNSNTDNLIGLNQEQANLMISAIEIRKKSVRDLMINIKNVFMIDFNQKLFEKHIQDILEKGFSRIPVYSKSKNNLLGILRIKQLIGKDFSSPKSLNDLNIQLKLPLIISPDLKIIELLREFIKGKSHIAIVTNDVENLQNKLNNNFCCFKKNGIEYYKVKNKESISIEGIITLEDVIENLINLQILDEDDYEKVYEKGNYHNMKNLKVPMTSVVKNFESKIFANNFISEESLKLESLIKDSYHRKSYKDLPFSKEHEIFKDHEIFKENQFNQYESDDRNHQLIPKDEIEDNKNYRV